LPRYRERYPHRKALAVDRRVYKRSTQCLEEKRFSTKISRSVATGALPILFGDVRRGYLINDRTGLRIFRDPYTAKALRIFLLHEASRGG
jgi:hypothetical protein